MNINTIKKFLINGFLVAVILIAGFRCAGQFAPPGGPSDTIPPVVLESYPVPGTTGFSDNVLNLSFSEWMDKRSVDESMFISPDLGELEIDWSGTDLEIKFTDSLRSNTTYVLTIGTDAKDLRAGNRMGEAFSLAFSTGDHIDSAAIAGMIYDEKPEGVMVFAYLLDGRNGDTLNPARTKPDYLTQTGKDGTFIVPYLRMGNYRLLAVRDEYKNLVYEPQVDAFGAPQQEFTLTPENDFLQGVQIRLTVEDTSAPFLSSSRAIDQQHVLLRFSENIDTSSLRPENISIVDTLSNVPLSIIDAAPSDSSSSEAILLTSEQDSAKTYRVTISGIKDLKGNAISRAAKPTDFDGGDTPDTTKPTIRLLTIENDSKDVFPGDTIMMGLNEWIIRTNALHSFSMQDSTKRNVDGELAWINSTHIRFLPLKPLTFGMPYTINVILDSLIDIAGNRFSDSIKTFKFQVIDKDKLGSITGSIEDAAQATNGRIFISAIPLSNSVRTQQQSLAAPGKFSFDNLEDGKYILSAFVDSDSNGVYSHGKAAPFQLSERFVYYPDTLKVRMRWSIENILIRIK